MAIRRHRTGLSRSARLFAGSSLLIGLVLTGAGVMQSFSNAASASPSIGVGQQLATGTGGLSEYSICTGVPGELLSHRRAADHDFDRIAQAGSPQGLDDILHARHGGRQQR